MSRRRTRSRRSSSALSPSRRLTSASEDDGVEVAKSINLDPDKREWEDQSPVTRKERVAWYINDFGNSVYFNTVLSAFLPPFLLLIGANAEDEHHQVAFLPGISISGSSYYSYAVSISVALQLVAFLFFGVIADYGVWRYRLLVSFGILGAVSTACFGILSPSILHLGGFLVVISNVSFGLAMIFYNAFLPILVRFSPQVIAKEGTSEQSTVVTRTSQHISNTGFIFGYVGGVVLLAVNTGIAVLVSFTIGGDECRKWCADCPSHVQLDPAAIALGMNESVRPWDPWKNVIQNSSLIGEGFAHSVDELGTSIAWPGRNPPCLNSLGQMAVAGVDHHEGEEGAPLFFDYSQHGFLAVRHYCPRRAASYCDEEGCRAISLPEISRGGNSTRTLTAEQRVELSSRYPDWELPPNSALANAYVLDATAPINGNVQDEDADAADWSADRLGFENNVLMCSPRRASQRCKADFTADTAGSRFLCTAGHLDRSDSQNGGAPTCDHFLCRRKDCSRGYLHESDETLGTLGCDPENTGLRINLSSGGLWWLFFGIIAYMGLKRRPGPPLTTNPFSRSLKQYYGTFRRIRSLPNTFRFLLAWWMISDGIGAITFGATSIAYLPPLSFNGILLGLLLLEVNLTGLLGNIFYDWLAKKMISRQIRKAIAGGATEDEAQALDKSWTSKVIIYVNVLCMCLLPIWAFPGLGMQAEWELFAAAFIYGLQVGSVQAFSRSLLQQFTPRGMDSEFFAFFEITDKGTSFLGPLVLGFANDFLGSLRYGLLLIVIFFLIGLAVLFTVNTEKAVREAKDFRLVDEMLKEEIKEQKSMAQAAEQNTQELKEVNLGDEQKKKRRKSSRTRTQ